MSRIVVPAVRCVRNVLAVLVVLAAAGVASGSERGALASPADAPSREEHAARSAASAAVADDAAQADGLPEVATFHFDPPFVGDRGLVAFDDGSLYAVDDQRRLIAFDVADVAVSGWSDLQIASAGDVRSDSFGRRLAVVGARPSSWGDPRTRVWDVSDPSRPAMVSETDACGYRITFLPGVEQAIAWGDDCTKLFRVDGGDVIFDFGRYVRDVTATEVAGIPWVLIRTWAGGGLDRLAAWDVGSSIRPVRRWLLEIDDDRPAQVSPDGTVLVVRMPGGELQVRDFPSGLPRAIVPTQASLWASTWVVGAGVRVLALEATDHVELWDLSDPSSPRLVGAPHLIVRDPRYGPLVSRPLVANADRPWLAVATADPVGFAVVDARDGGVLGRFDTPGLVPRALAWTRLADGSPAVAWSGRHRISTDVPRPEGGVARLDLVSVADPTVPEVALRFEPVTPSRVASVVPVGGRYVVVADVDANAVVLVDLAEGDVVDRIGTEMPMQARSWPPPPKAASGAVVALGDGRSVQRYEVEDGKLRHRGMVGPDPELGYAREIAALPDGGFAVLWGRAITTHLPDGTGGRVDLPFDAGQFEVSPAGDRAVAASGTIWDGNTAPSAGLDLADPRRPRLLWAREDGALFGTFVRGGEAVALTKRTGWRYAPFLHDPDSGEVLAEPLEGADPFFYFAPTAAFGSGADARLMYWQWTWCCWESVVFDVGGDAPRLLAHSEEYHWDAQALPRDDGRTAYDFRPWAYLVDADGSSVLYDTTEARDPSRLRHGFLVGHRRFGTDRASSAAVVLRDPEMNRSPTADAGADRTVECASPDGTPVVLDGAGSSDPDSTPGTEDDLARFDWTLDAAPAGEGRMIEARLAPGRHEIGLEVRDVLGASDGDIATASVVDSLPPDVDLELEPRLRGGDVWAREWAVRADAVDRCAGRLAVSTTLEFVPGARDAPIRSRAVDAAARIDVVRVAGGLEVRLIGPDPEVLLGLWNRARSHGGFALDAEPIRLTLAPPSSRGGERDLLARYRFGDDGRLEEATAFGPASDLVVAAVAKDPTGLEGRAHASMRATLAALCADLPGSAVCVSERGAAP